MFCDLDLLMHCNPVECLEYIINNFFIRLELIMTGVDEASDGPKTIRNEAKGFGADSVGKELKRFREKCKCFVTCH